MSPLAWLVALVRQLVPPNSVNSAYIVSFRFYKQPFKLWLDSSIIVLLVMSGCVSVDVTSERVRSDESLSTEETARPAPVVDAPVANPPDSTEIRNLVNLDGQNVNSTAQGAALALERSLLGDESPLNRGVTTRPEKKVYGYYAWWTRGLWLDIDLSLYDKLFFFTITPDTDGILKERNGWPFAWEGLARSADSLHIPLVPTLAMLDPDSIRTLFGDSASVEQLIASAMLLIEESNGAGLHIDIEFFEAADDTLKAGFQHFSDSLAQAADALYPQAELSIFVPALQKEGLIDVSRIPDRFTEIMVQGYDIHWQTGPRAGPVAPLRGWDGSNWQTIDSTFRALDIDPGRLVMTVPYYGYEWPVESGQAGAQTRGDGRIITYAQVDSLNLPDLQISALERIARHGMKRDEESGSPWYAWRDSTGWLQGWYEDEESLRNKYEFLDERRFGGIAVFPIGYDAGLLDTLLLEAFGARPMNPGLMDR